LLAQGLGSLARLHGGAAEQHPADRLVPGVPALEPHRPRPRRRGALRARGAVAGGAHGPHGPLTAERGRDQSASGRSMPASRTTPTSSARVRTPSLPIATARTRSTPRGPAPTRAP